MAAGSILTVDVDARSLSPASPLDSYLRLFSDSGSQLAFNDDFNGSLDSYLSFTVPTAGTYYIGVSSFNNSSYNPLASGSLQAGDTTGAYSTIFSVAMPALVADIVDVTPDPRSTAVDSISIAFNRAVTGLDLADLQLVRDGLNVSLAGAVVASTNGVNWVLSGLAGSTSSTGVYTLSLNASASGIVDAGNLPLSASASDSWTVTSAVLIDAGDTLATAAAIPVTVGSVRLSGTIGDGRNRAKDVDLYRVTLLAGQRFVVDIDARSLSGSSTLDSYLRLFNASGKQLASNDDFGGSYDSYLVYTARTAGTYYVGVSGYGNFNYTSTREASGRNGSTGVYQIALGFSAMPASTASNSIRVMGTRDSNNRLEFARQAAFATFTANCSAAIPSTPYRNLARR